MNIELIMNNMNLSNEEKEYIKKYHKDTIQHNIESIWKVIEDAGRYG